MAAYSNPHHWLYSDTDVYAEANTNYSDDGGTAADIHCRRNNNQFQYFRTSLLPWWVVQERTSNFKGAMLLPDQESMNLADAVALMFPDTMPSSFNFQYPSTFFHAHDPPAAAAASTTLKFSAEVAAGSSIKMEDQATPSRLQVGRYSMEERKDRILRYLKKRNQRNFTKTIKYACRKTLADRRVRVRGRFARNIDQLSDEDHQMRSMAKDNSSDDDPFIFTNSYKISSIQMKPQQLDIDPEDEWLQEAVANLELMYLPPPDRIHTSSIISP